MISHVLPSFRKSFRNLPKEIKHQAKSTYKRWKKNPFDKPLEFKQVHQTRPIFSVRIGLHWRALSVRDRKNVVTWFWIGSHEEYNKLIKQLRK